MKYLIASPTMTADEARERATAHGCCGYYMTCPPVWQEQSVAEDWAFPCVVTLGEDGLVASWAPVSA
jgi:hypothetical protein